MNKIHAPAALNRKFVEMMQLLNIYLNHFPKFEKYALTNRIRNTSYQMYDYIVEGQKRYHKKTTLTNLDITHEQLRMQLYLANELGYFNFKDGKAIVDSGLKSFKRYSAINLKVNELGCMIGGWINSNSE